eukprot:COSAG04_NODE_491_length_13463_cov_5.877432_19_plen_89_part_00
MSAGSYHRLTHARAVPQMQGVQGTNRGEEVNNRIFSRKMCGGSNCNGSFVKQFVDGDRVLRAQRPSRLSLFSCFLLRPALFAVPARHL